jgi:prepilin-type N-terminal cleavage/methylation domain-containing protein
MSQIGVHRNDSGFTLLELLVVITLLSIATLSGVLLLSDVGDRMAVARSAAQMEAALLALAGEASVTGYDRSAVFTRQGLARDEQNGKQIGQTESGISLDWIAAADVSSSAERGVVTFFGTGGTSGGKFVVARGGVRATIEIDWLTSRIRTYW